MCNKKDIMSEDIRNKVIDDILKHKLVVIIRGLEGETLYKCAKAMYDGGVRLMEITFDATQKVPEAKTASMIAELIKILPGDAHIGSGTVIDTSKVCATRAAGGRFIISPDTNEAVIKRTRELGMVSLPGALTPTEICNAHNYGADFVKLFPVGNFGPDYVKAVKAPLSHVRLLGVGGIEACDVKKYVGSGILGIGVGSPIVRKEYITSGQFDKITELASIYVEAVKAL